MTKEEFTISAMFILCTVLAVILLYFATTKGDVKVELSQCQTLLIQEAHDHTRQLDKVVSRLNFCLEVRNEH